MKTATAKPETKELNTELARQMIERADADQLPHDHVMRVKAMEFENVCNGYIAEPKTHTAKQLLGAWARARNTWCEYTKEPLL